MLSGKNILLGVTGSIAAYKAAYLTRLLIKSGASVKVIMTDAAREFITPLTLSTLSGNPVCFSFTTDDDGTWNNHVELANWADMIIVAPATADIIAKMASGLCDSLLMAVYLSSACQIFIAPAMDLEMYRHPTLKENSDLLKKRGNIFVPATYGSLASGLEGEGRMEEPDIIIDFINAYLLAAQPLNGKKALVTAGPTHESIDAVRFIGNKSSGKMGVEIARELAEKGAEVTLIAGPGCPESGKDIAQRIDVVSAEEMLNVCMKHFTESDITVMAAAVADFKPAHPSDQKIKKDGQQKMLELVPVIDILERMGHMKKPNQVLVGFALETEDETENAIKKLKKKNLDFIVLNSLRDRGAGFTFDTNKVSVIDRNLQITKFELKSKKEVAVDIVEKIIQKNV